MSSVGEDRGLHVALLRGINVGGKAKLPMKELAAAFAEAGANDVRTYIQSGNVVFRAEDADAVCARVTRQIAERYGYPGRIVRRTAAELRAAYGNNPFATAGANAALLHVYFLADLPVPKAVEALDLERSAPDAFAVVGREIYLHLPNGMARTKLTNVYFDKALATVSTARNWRTVGMLVEMLKA